MSYHTGGELMIYKTFSFVETKWEITNSTTIMTGEIIRYSSELKAILEGYRNE